MTRADTASPLHEQPVPTPPADAYLRSSATVLRGTDAQTDGARPLPARSLLGAGLAARLALVAGALALLWTTVLWALR